MKRTWSRAAGQLCLGLVATAFTAGCSADVDADAGEPDGAVASIEAELQTAEAQSAPPPPRKPYQCLLHHPAVWGPPQTQCYETLFNGTPAFEYLEIGDAVFLEKYAMYPGDEEGYALVQCNNRDNYPDFPYLTIEGHCRRTNPAPPYTPPYHPPQTP